MKKIVAVGATSMMARHTLRIWAQDPTYSEYVLIGRNEDRLTSVKNDICTRNSHATVQIITCSDMTDPNAIKETIDKTCENNLPDIVLIAHGFMPDNNVYAKDLTLLKQAVEINGISPVLFLQGFCNKMENYPDTRIAVIGSVAGDRGRMRNYIYGSGKALIAAVAEGLTHKFAQNNGPSITLIKPGPTATPMTAGMKGHFAEPADVAKAIVKAINNRKKILYVPGIWRLIMLIVRNIPYFIFKYIKS